MNDNIAFVRLTEIPILELVSHMSDPRVASHLPLLRSQWNEESAIRFVANKEECWKKDGLGHWAFLSDGNYAGWGGFQKEGDEWDFGLVLKPDYYGLGLRIARRAITFAKKDKRIPYVTFLLAPSRKNLRGLKRLGAHFVGEHQYEGMSFLKYRLDTE